MTGPVASAEWLDGLRDRAEASMIHTAVIDTEVVTELDNGDRTSEWILGTEQIPCLMQLVGTRIAEQAATQGVQAQWSVGFELDGPAIQPGRQRAWIRGERDDESGEYEWIRYVTLTGDMTGVVSKVQRIVTAVDRIFEQS